MTRRWSILLPSLGLALILACELLLLLGARVVAVNMTPLCWAGFLLVCSPLIRRPRRFVLCFLSGVGVWLFFDWVNFSFIHAWAYHGLDELSVAHVWAAKFVAFGAISPAMFLVADALQSAGLRGLRARALPATRGWAIAAFLAGIPALLFPFLVRDPVGCLTLWVALFLLLDPVNHRLGAPSLLGDWRAGRYGRTVSLLIAGLVCGVLWEFWNYWAIAKWTYSLPFLGPLERIKLFEMPLPGFLGFPPFALECWAAFQTILLALGRLGVLRAEALPDDGVL